jgi:hypothetical protein
MQAFLKRIIVVVFSTVILIPMSTYGADWEKPWQTVKHKSIASCKKTFEDYQLQAVCMDNEKKGYNRLQGNFGMPAKEARKAKERCEKVFDNFQLQAVCMDNESKGYKQMKQYE